MSTLRYALEALCEYAESSTKDTRPRDKHGPIGRKPVPRLTVDEIRKLLVLHPAESESRWPGYGVCTAEGRWGQCVFVAGHHEVEDWTPHADRFGRTWNDQPAEDAR